jgi:dienelactone hydrolase
MAEVVLFHHAQGLTSGILAFADRLRDAGHIAFTPDLFEGQTFDTLEKGMEYVNEIGFMEVLNRGEIAVQNFPAGLVYIGCSLGVIPAQKLAQTRMGALGAILMYSCLPRTEFGSFWPKGVPVQVHAMDADPFFIDDGDIDAAKELVKEVEEAELFLYQGNQHIFADNSLLSYDEKAAEELTARIIDFLNKIIVWKRN